MGFNQLIDNNLTLHKRAILAILSRKSFLECRTNKAKPRVPDFARIGGIIPQS